MVTLTSLWLAIVLAGVAVFILSSIMHMALPIHRGDMGALAGEDDVLAAMREAKVTPGDYYFPFSDCKDMKSEAQKEKWATGPVGFMTVLPNGPPAMGKALGIWFVYTLVVGFFVAYVTGRALDPAASYLQVFRISGAVAFLAYAGGAPVPSIWKGQKWSTSFKFVFDGLTYALVTAGVFGWLWPG